VMLVPVWTYPLALSFGIMQPPVMLRESTAVTLKEEFELVL
jgi:hypothetical protein